VTPEGKEDDSDDENAIIGMETVNMVLNLWHFIMTTKDILDHVMDSSEILQELTKKSLLKQVVQKKCLTFLQNKHGKFVSFYVLHALNYHSDIFSVSQCNTILL
jgi:hypothetical protein